MMTAPPDPLRCAALALHAASDADRTWLLQSLAEQERTQLAPLLGELQALGFPHDPALLRQWPSDSDVSEPSSPAWPEDLDPTAIAALARVLACEPPAVAQCLLAMKSWDWRTELLSAMDDAARVAVQQTRSDPAPAPRLCDAVLQALREAITRELGQKQPVARGAWYWLRARTRRSGRQG